MGKGMVCIFVVMLMLVSGCKTSAVDTENSAPDDTSAFAAIYETKKNTAKATVITVTPAETTKEVPTPTAAETTADATASTTTATTAATAKTTRAPAPTTTATTAAPPPETVAATAATALETAATTTAPAIDYTAACADIRAKLIALLEANGQWDPNFTGKVNSWGQVAWGIGWLNDMTTQEFADYYYNGKFAGGTINACGVDCYVADDKIYLDYQGYYVT